jgi:D-alanine-D-alanine ligase
MRVILLHNAVSEDGAPDERDVLVQAHALQETLERLSHESTAVPCTLNLADVKQRLAELRPDLVFNLVEALDGTGRLIHVVPAFLDALRIPYTGSGAEVIHLTSHKTLAKQRLAAFGLPTPRWIGPYPEDVPVLPPGAGGADDAPDGSWIVKSVWEHASIGLDETEALLCDGEHRARALMRERAPRLGGSCFAERFIDGREFNLSLLAGPDGPTVLRPAEILFEGYPERALRIVGYRAKWAVDSYEFHHTPRRFDFSPADAPLLQRLQDLARQCWHAFGLRGYARVDFRVGADGRPWILEINANPCLSPDAGYAAALQASNVSFPAAVARILAHTRSSLLPETKGR